MGYAERLGVAPERAGDVLEHFERERYEGREYRRLGDARHGLERGTVLIDGVVVRGYPKVPRTLTLSEGVPRHFDGPLIVEEKLNGYNVRVARVGDLLAFTRGGYVCPYTTHLVRERDFGSLFEDRPDLVLCGEVIGPENPYTEHDYDGVDSAAFRAFDLRERETGAPLPVDERRRLCDSRGVPQTRSFGRYDSAEAPDAVENIVRSLDDEGREGVVMQSLDGRRQLKYTTASAHRDALAHAFSLPFDYGRDFVFRRVIREAFQSVEFEEDEATARERAHRLGEAILLPMIETIEAVEDGETPGERHTVRGDPDAIERLIAHFRECNLPVTVESDRREDGERVVAICKEMQSTADKVENYLNGHVVDE
ncbi:RNA ligase [Halostella sp. JP-L12]|uniref:RNA ligase n=1 Tax=Halostella TaxID=1843185 RepID=UPI000EF7F5C0|nr:MULTISPECIES: RNA ligase [Halostella]NHN47904.1 RNA ligase [Halostella sp. JP-L12]